MYSICSSRSATVTSATSRPLGVSADGQAGNDNEKLGVSTAGEACDTGVSTTACAQDCDVGGAGTDAGYTAGASYPRSRHR